MINLISTALLLGFVLAVWHGPGWIVKGLSIPRAMLGDYIAYRERMMDKKLKLSEHTEVKQLKEQVEILTDIVVDKET